MQEVIESKWGLICVDVVVVGSPGPEGAMLSRVPARVRKMRSYFTRERGVRRCSRVMSAAPRQPAGSSPQLHSDGVDSVEKRKRLNLEQSRCRRCLLYTIWVVILLFDLLPRQHRKRMVTHVIVLDVPIYIYPT